MQIAQEDQNFKNRVKNTFSTDSSKRENEIENDENFKNERQKYLKERLNRRNQVKQVRKQNFGSSSSQSEKSVQKQKAKPKIIKDFQMAKPKDTEQQKLKNQQEKFHTKHQAYLKEKLARKQEMIEQRRKQFGSSSSDSDDQIIPTKVEGIKIIQPPTIKQQAKEYIQPQTSNQKTSPVKRSIGSQSNDNQRSPVIVQQIVMSKGEKVQQAKKLTILIQSKKNLQWIEETLVIENKRIKFINQNIQFMIAYVTKIKLFFTSVSKDYFKIKITIKDDDFFFAASSKTKTDNLPDYFYIFSRIIQEKLTQIGFEPKKNQSTIFPNYMNLKDAPTLLKNSAHVFGNILKKSQILGNWETRFVYITEKEIGSSKKPNDKPSMVISADSINQLWTRFDIENNSMLNVKIMYNSNTKTEFGIPLSNFTDQYNWLYCFYRIIKTRV